VILSDIEGSYSLFKVLLTAIPSREWRAAFVGPPVACQLSGVTRLVAKTGSWFLRRDLTDCHL
jgi:hypothetical protein